MKVPSDFERDLGRAMRSALGTQTRVVRFGDDQGLDDCFIVSGPDCPVRGVTSYASIGLNRSLQQAGSKEVMVEIVTACASITPHIDNIIASCVFDSRKNGSNISYGSCIPDIISQYNISDTLKHVTFVAPFLWDGLGKISINGRDIYCLLMLPISDEEMMLIKNQGIDVLEDLFSKDQIDIFDINRGSVIPA